MMLLLLIALAIGTISADNTAYFDGIIENVNLLETSWTAGHNFGPDATLSSIKRLLGLKKSDYKLQKRIAHEFSTSKIPEKFDARKKWPNCPTIDLIRDQGNCGSCWAVATTSTFTDRLCIISKGRFKLQLSAEDVLSCCPDCGWGCGGGYDARAWDYFRFSGVVTGGEWKSNVGCQPYTMEACEHLTNGTKKTLRTCSSMSDEETPECKHRCSNPSYKRTYTRDHHKVVESYSLEEVTAIQKDILEFGPVTAGMVVYEDFLTYKSGVYARTQPSKELGGHAVRIIGWGTENNVPYWLVANSWNTHWGDNGYFKIRRGTNECGIEEEVTAGIPSVINSYN